jgi:uncharacterized protein
MTISLYDITLPVFDRGLGVLAAVLDKGRSHVEANGLETEALLAARLAPDMLNLAGQVQRASDTAKFAAVRIGGVANEPFADEEKTLADLQDRIARTRAFLAGVTRGAIDGKEDVVLSVKIGQTPREIAARDYVLGFALPNFYFHVTTAYDLLRQAGVPLGKMDYIGPLG